MTARTPHAIHFGTASVCQESENGEELFFPTNRIQQRPELLIAVDAPADRRLIRLFGFNFILARDIVGIVCCVN